MNLWDTILTSVVTVAATAGPMFLRHHAKLKAAADILQKLINAANGEGPVPEISTTRDGRAAKL
jgi:hypothetical protein